MEIISDNKILISKFKKLIINCKHISILTAWATNKNPLSEVLYKNSNKFYKVIVGLKFYQTDPKFLNRYLKNQKIQYIKNDTSGVFHPKVYLFESDSKWHLFIGSSNFTQQGFGKNIEISLYQQSDNFNDLNYLKIKKVISEIWNDSSKMSKSEILEYSKIYNIQKTKVNSLSGKYEKNKRTKPIYKIPILNSTWKEYVKKIKKNEEKWKIDGRIELLNITKQYFIDKGELLYMNKNQRQEISGIGSNQNLMYGSFGTMSARGFFKSYINNIVEHPILSKALNEIPLSGNISKVQYMNYIDKFNLVFTEANEIAGATRLLTIKRPDVFVNLNSKNKDKLCGEFGISKNIGFEEYWDSIICRIQDSDWWKNPRPKGKLELEIIDKRAAFLDSIYFER